MTEACSPSPGTPRVSATSRGRETLPQSLRREWGPPHLRCWTSGLQNVRGEISAAPKPPLGVTCHSSHDRRSCTSSPTWTSVQSESQHLCHVTHLPKAEAAGAIAWHIFLGICATHWCLADCPGGWGAAHRLPGSGSAFPAPNASEGGVHSAH